MRQIEQHRCQAGQQVVPASSLRYIAQPQQGYRSGKEAAHVMVVGRQRAGQRKEQVMPRPGLRAKNQAIGCIQQHQAEQHSGNVHAGIRAVQQEDKGHGHNGGRREPRFGTEKTAAKAVNEPDRRYATEQKGQLDGDLAVAEELDPVEEEKLHQGRMRIPDLHAVGDFVGKAAVNGAAEGAELVVAELVLPQGNEAKGDP